MLNRILLFTTAFRPFIGGSELAIEEIAKRLPDVHFDIITPRYTRRLPRIEEGGNARVYRVGWGLLSDKFFFSLTGFLLARQLIRANPYNIIHAYQASYGAGAAWLLKIFNPKLKFVLTLQEGKNLKRQGFGVNFFRKLIIRKADVITAISQYLKDYAGKINKKAKLFLIPNGVDIESFSRDFSYGELSLLTDSLGIKPDEKVIVTVSRLVPKNGVDILIKAFQILNSKFAYSARRLQSLWRRTTEAAASAAKAGQIPDSKLLIVGDGPEMESLKLQAKSLGLIDKVFFAGSVNHIELPGYLKISDVFARPSRSEGLGSAFLEAMAAGTPVIGTCVGGIPDFLKNKGTGLFADIDSPKDWAEKINLILTNKELREKIVKNARELAKQKYDWNKIAEQFKEIYKI